MTGVVKATSGLKVQRKSRVVPYLVNMWQVLMIIIKITSFRTHRIPYWYLCENLCSGPGHQDCFNDTVNYSVI